jgi:hypothetical protein
MQPLARFVYQLDQRQRNGQPYSTGFYTMIDCYINLGVGILYRTSPTKPKYSVWQSYPCAHLIKHYAMEAYGEVDV